MNNSSHHKVMESTFDNPFCQYFSAQMSLKFVKHFVLQRLIHFKQNIYRLGKLHQPLSTENRSVFSVLNDVQVL